MALIEFLAVNEVTLIRGEPTPSSSAYEAAVAESWRKAIKRNPSLFNGPIVSPLQANVIGAAGTVRWRHSDFAHYLFSRQNRDLSPVAAVGTVFVSIGVPTTDGRLVVGRMSGNTAAPGVVQLPGGGVAIGAEQAEVAQHDLIAVALQEAREELGIVLDPASLRVCGLIKRQRPPDIGIVFATEPRAWQQVQLAFTQLQQREQLIGAVPEFDELLAIGPNSDLFDSLTRRGEVVDYLPVVVDALLKTGGVTA